MFILFFNDCDKSVNEPDIPVAKVESEKSIFNVTSPVVLSCDSPTPPVTESTFPASKAAISAAIDSETETNEPDIPVAFKLLINVELGPNEPDIASAI